MHLSGLLVLQTICQKVKDCPVVGHKDVLRAAVDLMLCVEYLPAAGRNLSDEAVLGFIGNEGLLLCLEEQDRHAYLLRGISREVIRKPQGKIRPEGAGNIVIERIDGNLVLFFFFCKHINNDGPLFQEDFRPDSS